MSLIARVKPLPQTQRAFSSFFSSNPGGGRNFNSAKPPKPVVPAGKGKGQGSGTSKDVTVNASGASLVNGGSGIMKTAGDEASSVSTHERASQRSHTSNLSLHSTPSFLTGHKEPSMFPRHPAMTAQDYKLHQFFSLHRPLLLHAQPVSALFESHTQSVGLFGVPIAEDNPPVSLGTLDDPPEASADADADAARLLARALVINRVGATISWENTMETLGLEGNSEANRVEMAQEWAREWDTIYADSVKRKKKKKMKKHKLKKRRREQRSQKLKLK